ncbi:hypothetical protein M1D97_09345 [Kushneria sp. AK178]
MPHRTLWIITLTNERPVSEMASRLSQEGLAIREQLDEIGCITGEADNDVAERIRGLEGVVDIALNTPMDIGFS